MIEIPGIGRPRPAAHFDPGRDADIFELAVSLIAIQGISARVMAVECANVIGVVFA